MCIEFSVTIDLHGTLFYGAFTAILFDSVKTDPGAFDWLEWFVWAGV